MAKKKTQIPEGFSDILDTVYSNVDHTDEVTIIDDNMGYTDEPPVEDQDDTIEPPVENNTEDGKNVDDSDLELSDTSTTDDTSDDDSTTQITDDDVTEAQQVGLLFDAIGESLGWNMSDIEEQDRPLNVDQLTNYLKAVVQENSVPQYADDRVQQLDEFIKNGGKFEDFYQLQQSRLSIDNIDMEDETNQKAVVRELLKYQGYTDEQINKRIARYEDADMLSEESEDALDRIKAIRKIQEQEAYEAQQQAAEQQKAESEAFFKSITKDIENLTNIRGIAIPKEDRKALFDYIFKLDNDGLSQYQKDFNQNLAKNLIESAYFTMKADTLVSTARKEGESSAAERLRKMLRHSAKNHSTYNADEKQKSATDLISGMF